MRKNRKTKTVEVTRPVGPQGSTGPGSNNEYFFESSAPQDLDSPLFLDEELNTIKKFYDDNPVISNNYVKDKLFASKVIRRTDPAFDPKEAWVQTYSGIRFSPLNPNIDAIVIQDIAHALSMMCRFSGHIKRFYSVAQHCVLVSYLCDSADALYGLLHDASEAYLVDLPSPLKRSGQFETLKGYENILQAMIYKRFGLSEQEPKSVKVADTKMLYTESRDLFKVMRSDWEMKEEPYPFKIEPLSQQDAKNLFMKRFFELSGHPGAYEHYLSYESNDINKV